MPVGTKKQVEINGDIIMAVITVLEMTNKGYKGGTQALLEDLASTESCTALIKMYPGVQIPQCLLYGERSNALFIIILYN